MQPRKQRIEDSYAFQLNRLAKLVAERAPGKILTYDDSRTLIHFRITDPITDIVLVPAVGEWEPRELADKADDELWKWIQQLSNGKL